MPCSVSEILTKYQETNSIFADGIFDFDRLTIQNSSFQFQFLAISLMAKFYLQAKIW